MEMVYLNATNRGHIRAHLRNFSVVSNRISQGAYNINV